VLSRLSPARRRFVLGLVALLLVAVVAVVVSALVQRRSSAPPDQSRPGPVLLVPGYGGSEESLAPLATALRGRGRDVTVVSLPDQARGDLDGQTQALGAAVDEALARTGAASVDLVGYSAGGIVARLWVTEGGGRSVTRRLVTLGSPHHGTEIAALGTVVSGTCPTACQQLAPDSAVLSRLDSEPLPAGVVLLSLWSTSDDVVLPPSSAVIAGVPSPSLQSICASSRVRHSGLPGDRLVQGLVVEALGSGPLPTWTTTDCARLSS
ncbi:alpha/beta fold hydrolase, partial [Lapillicoccus sp.]|uniref:lipase family alpha/beta hydrolase n=1 Tax=Lapillicoccus sp. TaxID=1909287 RepID=UPI00344CA95B